MKSARPIDILLPYQAEYRADKSRFKALCAARQTGKDFTSMEEPVADCFLNGKATHLVAAPSERQSLETLEKAKEWTEVYQLEIADIDEDRAEPQALIKSTTIKFVNGSRIIAVPGRPDTVRGYSAHAYLTEFAFFDDPAATWKAIMPSITNPMRGGVKNMRVYSTPNGKTGQGAKFYDIFEKNFFNPQPSRKQQWSCHRITIHDAVKAGLPIDIEEIREAMDDPEAFAQEYECEFLDGSNTLLPYDLIATAESVLATENAPGDYWTRRGRPAPLVLGIDFGRVNDPTVCWALERSPEGIQTTREVLCLRGMNTKNQEDVLRPRIECADRVCLDYTGPGIGLGDHLALEYGEWNPDRHLFGKIELCTFTTGFKRELFPKMRRAFEAPTTVRIPISIEVREDLHAMQQTVKNGEYTYSAPRTAQGHSDRCTALALAIRAAGEQAPFFYQTIPMNRRQVINGRFSKRRLA